MQMCKFLRILSFMTSYAVANMLVVVLVVNLHRRIIIPLHHLRLYTAVLASSAFLNLSVYQRSPLFGNWAVLVSQSSLLGKLIS